MKASFEKSKNLNYAETTVKILSSLNEESTAQLNELANELCKDYLAKQDSTANKNDLTALFFTYNLSRFSFFVPHAEGRGATLDPIRLTQPDLTVLNPASLRHFNAALYHTPSKWQELLPSLPAWEQRAITIALTPQNIDALEQEDFSAAIARVEALDDAYHAAVPSTEALLSRYAQPADQCLYSRRDLSQSLQRRYIRDHALSLYDIHDERQSFVRRF